MEPASEPVSARVINVVAEMVGVDPTELPPLYESIDPDALDALFDQSEDGMGPDHPAIEVQFEYADQQVLVQRNGEIEVVRAD